LTGVRTTIEIPDSLFHRAGALAATRGITLEQLIVTAVEREFEPAGMWQKPLPLPVIHLEPGRTLDLTTFNFDDSLS
jgi:hypothetical protein